MSGVAATRIATALVAPFAALAVNVAVRLYLLRIRLQPAAAGSREARLTP